MGSDLPRELEHVVTDPVDTEEIGGLLRRIRERTGQTQAAIAESTGARSQNIARLESGKSGREPALSTITRYLGALGWEAVLVFRPAPLPRARKSGKKG